MSDIAIRVDGLGKQYRIGRRERYRTLRDTLADTVSSPFRKIGSLLGPSDGTRVQTPSDLIWALRDVSFAMPRGAVVGIIGRNGAGKSTLLKVLSRITEPTEGCVEIHGRVGSLLEVGTGFHPELTGGENIFLNGAILGMRKAEIKQKFDEMVAFAGIERFIATPVKHFSSGMYMRLAFAVAAYLEPDVLVVDEVLAVGDSEFQRKCLGKMGDVAREGRTVLFVSHNLSAVAALCNRALYFEEGALVADGNTADILASYSRSLDSCATSVARFAPQSTTAGFVEIAIPGQGLTYGDILPIMLTLQAPRRTEAAVEIEIHDERGLPIAYTSTAPLGGQMFILSPEAPLKLMMSLGPLRLAAGRYYLSFWLIKPWTENYHIVHHAVSFDVDRADPCGTGFDFRQSYGRGAVTFPIHVTEAL